MAAPLRGTQSLVGQMAWVFNRPSLTLLEVGWRWLFGIPFLLVCWMQAERILIALPAESTGLGSINPGNPWTAAVQLVAAWSQYKPHLMGVFYWLFPACAAAWVVASGAGRSLVLRRMEPGIRFRPVGLMALQGAWLVFLCAIFMGWFRCVGWAAATHITTSGEPDLVGYFSWVIFLSLGFFTLFALISWPFSIAPIVMLLEECSAMAALGRSFTLGRQFNSKLVEVNLVMGIVKLALIVVAMVLSAAPLPFSDQLGPDALNTVGAAAVVFYLVASDYFQVVRLKSFVEFWRIYRGQTMGRH